MNRRWWTWSVVVALLIVGGVVWASVAGGSKARTASPGLPAMSAPPTPTATPTSPSPNSLSADGGVSFSVVGADCNHRSAAGATCYVTIHAVNVSDGFPVFTEADQAAYDPSGQVFHPDRVADAAANHRKPVTQRLPRGTPVTDVLVFPVPAGDRIDHVVLHGKPGTPGELFTLPR